MGQERKQKHENSAIGTILGSSLDKLTAAIVCKNEPKTVPTPVTMSAATRAYWNLTLKRRISSTTCRRKTIKVGDEFAVTPNTTLDDLKA